jgi:hypothetical protein
MKPEIRLNFYRVILTHKSNFVTEDIALEEKDMKNARLYVEDKVSELTDTVTKIEIKRISFQKACDIVDRGGVDWIRGSTY